MILTLSQAPSGGRGLLLGRWSASGGAADVARFRRRRGIRPRRGVAFQTRRPTWRRWTGRCVRTFGARHLRSGRRVTGVFIVGQAIARRSDRRGPRRLGARIRSFAALRCERARHRDRRHRRRARCRRTRARALAADAGRARADGRAAPGAPRRRHRRRARDGDHRARRHGPRRGARVARGPGRDQGGAGGPSFGGRAGAHRDRCPGPRQRGRSRSARAWEGPYRGPVRRRSSARSLALATVIGAQGRRDIQHLVAPLGSSGGTGTCS